MTVVLLRSVGLVLTAGRTAHALGENMADFSRRAGKFVLDYLLSIAGTAATICALLLVGLNDPTGNLKTILIVLAVYQLALMAVVCYAIFNIRQLSLKDADNQKFINGVLYSDQTFRELAEYRSEFDQESFEATFVNGSFDRDRLLKELMRYLSFLCDATESIIANRKGIGQNQCAVNIKLFFPDGERVAYKTVAASDHYAGSRWDAQFRRKRDYGFDENSCFVFLRDNRSKEYFISNDMSSYILNKANDDFPEPNNVALNYYTKCIIVPVSQSHDPKMIGNGVIHGSSGKGDPALSSVSGIVGMISIDSKSDSVRFDETFDVSILREMAIHAYSAYHQYNLLFMIAHCGTISLA